MLHIVKGEGGQDDAITFYEKFTILMMIGAVSFTVLIHSWEMAGLAAFIMMWIHCIIDMAILRYCGDPNAPADTPCEKEIIDASPPQTA